MIIKSEIKLLTTADLPVLVTIHQTAFPDSAITRLGQEAIKRYYHWLLSGPHPEAFRIGLFNDNQLLGFCFGGRFNSATGGFLQQNRFFIAGRVLTHPWFIFNPLFRERIKAGFFILRRIRQSRSTSTIAWQELANPSFGILAIATHPSFHGQGIGKCLMIAAEEQAQQKGFRQMHLTVNPHNYRAVGFYEGLGWQKQKTDDVWHGVMRKNLTTT